MTLNETHADDGFKCLERVRAEAMADGWNAAADWLIEIYELDAARKMKDMLRQKARARLAEIEKKCAE